MKFVSVQSFLALSSLVKVASGCTDSTDTFRYSEAGPYSCSDLSSGVVTTASGDSVATICANRAQARSTCQLTCGECTADPTASPTDSPTVSPTASPTDSPTVSPTASPTDSPTTSPTDSPTVSPTSSPTVSSAPTATVTLPYDDCGDRDSDESFGYRNRETCTTVFRMKRPEKIDICTNDPEAETLCPFACGKCCDDDDSVWFKFKGKDYTCEKLRTMTNPQKVTDICTAGGNKWQAAYYCPTVCGTCFFDGVTEVPSDNPTKSPTTSPTDFPTTSPTPSPTDLPTQVPSDPPTDFPTTSPTPAPTDLPTFVPSEVPTVSPTSVPSDSPSNAPSDEASDVPTLVPSTSPTVTPTMTPTSGPTDSPTAAPTGSPTDTPTDVPSMSPSEVPTMSPTKTCVDFKGKFSVDGLDPRAKCKKAGTKKKYCRNDEFREACAKSCGACIEFGA